MKNAWIATFIFIAALAAIFYVDPAGKQNEAVPEPQPAPVVQLPPTPVDPSSPKITTVVPSYLDYVGIMRQLKEWESQAPDLVDVGTYGRSTMGQDLFYARLTNEKRTGEKKKVLLTSSIHGNEPLSTGVMVGFFGTILSKYGQEQEVTAVLNTQEIYLIPVVCPDSYPDNRRCDGVDPNRDFPSISSPNRISISPIRNIQKFFLTVKPDAVISGHTFGRVILIPWGDKQDVSPNHQDYVRITNEMARTANYGIMRACQMYNRPIMGGELDWYYKNGSFSIVMEFGTHQEIPTYKQITDELNRTYIAIFFFIKESVKVQVRSL